MSTKDILNSEKHTLCDAYLSPLRHQHSSKRLSADHSISDADTLISKQEWEGMTRVAVGSDQVVALGRSESLSYKASKVGQKENGHGEYRKG
jgi:hypothetical protein